MKSEEVKDESSLISEKNRLISEEENAKQRFLQELRVLIFRTSLFLLILIIIKIYYSENSEFMWLLFIGFIFLEMFPFVFYLFKWKHSMKSTKKWEKIMLDVKKSNYG